MSCIKTLTFRYEYEQMADAYKCADADKHERKKARNVVQMTIIDENDILMKIDKYKQI